MAPPSSANKTRDASESHGIGKRTRPNSRPDRSRYSAIIMELGGRAVMTNHSEMLRRWQLLSPYLDRQQQTFWAAAEAEVLGRGGCLQLAGVTGIASQTISKRKRQLELTGTAQAGSLVPLKRSAGAG